MERQPVTSSNIRSIGYDASTSTLEVEFRSGEVYQYFGMPASVHLELMQAASHGSYLQRHIRGTYRYLRVK